MNADTLNYGGCPTGANTQIEPAKVIARYADGRILKGYSHDFFPNKTTFHIFPLIDGSPKEGTMVQVGDLKAIFFVRDFTGDPSRDEQKIFPTERKSVGRKIEITFIDGEILTGTVVGYTPNRAGFFLFPADFGSNNLRVFVISSAVKSTRFL